MLDFVSLEPAWKRVAPSICGQSRRPRSRILAFLGIHVLAAAQASWHHVYVEPRWISLQISDFFWWILRILHSCTPSRNTATVPESLFFFNRQELCFCRASSHFWHMLEGKLGLRIFPRWKGSSTIPWTRSIASTGNHWVLQQIKRRLKQIERIVSASKSTSQRCCKAIGIRLVAPCEDHAWCQEFFFWDKGLSKGCATDYLMRKLSTGEDLSSPFFAWEHTYKLTSSRNRIHTLNPCAPAIARSLLVCREASVWHILVSTQVSENRQPWFRYCLGCSCKRPKTLWTCVLNTHAHIFLWCKRQDCSRRVAVVVLDHDSKIRM